MAHGSHLACRIILFDHQGFLFLIGLFMNICKMEEFT